MKQKRKAFRTFNTQEQILTSPHSILPPPQIRKININQKQDPNNLNNNEALLNLIHYANVMNIFKQSITRFKGTNIPVMYKPNYKFSEKWEEANKVKYENSDNVYLAANNVCLILAIIVMVYKIPFIWYLSVYKIFELQASMAWWNIALCFIIIDLLLKLYLVYLQYLKVSEKSQHGHRFFSWNTIHNFIWDFMSIFIIILQLTVTIQKMTQIFIGFIIVIVQINRFNQIYNSLTIILISNKYKNYVNLFNFISKLFTCLHIFAIIIYSTTLLQPDDNWLRSIDKDQTDPITRYIYSIYFTGTTMFTVGYGDILPVNSLEIIVILIIQVVGIILIGYIVSQIGHTLSIMRQIRQDFQQDIQNADTVCDRYNLSEDLKQRVRNYVVNHRLANQQLNTNEQQNFLMKLNEQLRNQVKYVNHLKIIKTSLFFICNWSKKMQNDLSKKLQKFIFSPNQPITRQDKLYIISRGKIDVFIQKKSGNKVYCKKHLKTLQRDPSKEVHANAYGYTSLFTNKPHNLSAISKDFAICYALDYADILEAIKDDQKDFENYHQINQGQA